MPKDVLWRCDAPAGSRPSSLCVRQNDDKVFFESSSLQVSTKWLKALSDFSCVFLKEHFLLLFLSPLAQSELEEMSQPISCGIQREQNHYWLMRRRGIEAFILITVMCVCKRAACTCFSSTKHLFFLFLVPAASCEWILAVREGN